MLVIFFLSIISIGTASKCFHHIECMQLIVFRLAGCYTASALVKTKLSIKQHPHPDPQHVNKAFSSSFVSFQGVCAGADQRSSAGAGLADGISPVLRVP